jgi:hypothetical protein
MITILRVLFRIAPPRIDRAQAFSIAEKLCNERGWKIYKPRVVEGLKVWTIWTNSELKGSPRIEIDNQSGEVLKIATIRR